MFESRKTAYQMVLVISATFSLLSVIVIFSTFPVFYTYFHRVTTEISTDIKYCKYTAQNVYFFVNQVEYFDSNRPFHHANDDCGELQSFLLS